MTITWSEALKLTAPYEPFTHPVRVVVATTDTGTAERILRSRGFAVTEIKSAPMHRSINGDPCWELWIR